MNEVQQFLSGAICMGYATAGLFFLKFWCRTKDPLFLTFALAIGLLAGLRIALSGLEHESELRFYLYGGRLLAYLLILWGIFQKNRRALRRRG